MALCRISILDRYITKEFLTPFCFCIGGFTVILVSGYLFDLMDFIFIKKVPVTTVLRLLGYKLPATVVISLPLGVLFATLLALGRLAGDNELTVMRSAGLSILRVVLPVLVLGLVVSGITYVANEEIVPEMNHREATLMRRIIFQDALPTVEERVFFRDPRNRFFYIEKVDRQKKRLQRVMVYDLETGSYPRLITAATGRYTDVVWYLENGVIRELDEAGFVKAEARFDSLQLQTIKESERLFGEQKTTEEMNRAELREHIELFQKSGLEVKDFVVDYHLKLALPFASLVFALLGAPLSFRSSRGGRTAGIVISLIIMFLYYVVTSVARSLGANGVIPPLAAAWLSNILFAGLGTGLLVVGR